MGDSPIPGSGAYVDNDIGAAVATGDGDIMMRFLPRQDNTFYCKKLRDCRTYECLKFPLNFSYQAVENMRHEMTPTEAAEDALRRIVKRYKKFQGALVVANKQGEYGMLRVDCTRLLSTVEE